MNADLIREWWSLPERATWAPPEDISVSEWAKRYRLLPDKLAAEPGPWNEDRTPYVIEVMNAFQDSQVERITIKASVQSAKTEAVYNMLGYAICQDPRPALLVMPTLETLTRVNDRIKLMIEDSPEISKHLVGERYDVKKKRIDLDRMRVYFATAGSSADLRNVQAAIIILDEVDDYPDDVGDQGSPIMQAEGRAATFVLNRKIITLCTPTIEGSNVDQAWERSDKRKYWVPCPLCGGFQILNFFQIKHVGEPLGEWPPGEKRDPNYIMEERPGRYECKHCKGEIADAQKPGMVKGGIWVPEVHEGKVDETTVPAPYRYHVGYWWNALYSPWQSFSALMAEFFETKKDRTTFQTFWNLKLAENWVEQYERLEEDQVLAACCDLPSRTVPEDAVALTCGIDRQETGFYYLVRAWRVNDFNTREETLTSWLIDYGFLSSWYDLEALLFGTAYPIQGIESTMRIWRAGIDTGGTLLPRPVFDPTGGHGMIRTSTEDTMVWLRNNSRGRGCFIWGTKGSRYNFDPGEKIRLGKPKDKYPSGKPIPGGLQIANLDTRQLKDMFMDYLEWARNGEERGAYLHKDTGPDYTSQITAEEKRPDKRGRMMWTQIRADNHYLDCFDLKTEILTRHGWMPAAEIENNHECATVNLETDQIEYQKPMHLIGRWHSGQMISIRGRRIDILVTPNHRMVIYGKKFDGRKGIRKHIFNGPPVVKLAKDLIIWDRIKLAGKWTGVDSQYFKIPSVQSKNHIKYPELAVDSLDFAEFLGWYVSEGHRNKPRCNNSHSYRIVISQSPGRKSERIKALLGRLPWRWRVDQGRQYAISSKQLYMFLDNIGIGIGSVNKRVPQLIKDASSRVISRFLESAVLGDGWTQRGHRAYATISEGLANDIQELFIKIGRSANIKTVQPPNCRIRGDDCPARLQYHISECKTKAASLRDYKNRSLISSVPYVGMVYCVTVPNGTLVCRRNGKSFIAGNCEVIAHALADPGWAGGVRMLRGTFGTTPIKKVGTPETGQAVPGSAEKPWIQQKEGGWLKK